ncbi:hypothetical protein OVY29_03790 [Sphingopyxis sp. SE2]|uniref:hypothetical protein n=1 Tax=Sphingopyxis sp. SE2 TaxID=1586240 RepID=UPI0028C1A779|nr:hypothetical protein [Sphingopyxis sp. SE2]MDT7527784.1 hypothetical protein [Sphingopyxis sp. SE2]
MAKKPTLVEELNAANNDAWLGNFEDDPAEVGPLHPYWKATRKLIAKHPDEDLAELIATTPNSREAHLAVSILRVREGWKSPARWSMLISGASLFVAGWAFLRTL